MGELVLPSLRISEGLWCREDVRGVGIGEGVHWESTATATFLE